MVGSDIFVATYLSHPQTNKGLNVVEDTIVHLVFTEWLSVIAPYLYLDNCVLCGAATLSTYKFP